ncbi:Spc98 family-domain-containing protein [Suillus paluster]|uniref:Spc98 family-domain-containing protein n=1 Tax=Suillus paluster TaxID=48578 RepID=UPI001B874450|nr:Spc98 family-domain-containing protein [Suillus paluster]KAG1717437.1 Spc98 family-domain-containing protein [Suillus paluster]
MSTPSSTLSARPHSRALHQRPSSSLSQRPPSSASFGRPVSSASLRPPSRVSRPSSRISRPVTRQSTRLLPLCQTLITQLTELDLENDEEDFRIALDFVSRNLEHATATKGGPSSDMATMDRRFHGFIEKSRIQSNDTLAEALEISYRKVKDSAKELTNIDGDIKLSHLPDHLQLLALLSAAPMHIVEAVKNPPEAPPSLTWKDILDEEPFEGQHWEGVYGLPPGSTIEGWEQMSDSSTPSLSPWDEDSDDLDDNDSFTYTEDPPSSPVPVERISSYGQPNLSLSYHHRRVVEELQARQYWREEWRTDADVSQPFNLGDASTLGPSLSRALGERTTLLIDGPEHEKYINEHDAVREVLMCLQGRKNFMITSNSRSPSLMRPSPSAPRLIHLTLASQTSILSSFAQLASKMSHIRKFTSAVFSNVFSTSDPPLSSMHLLSHNTRSQTIEAFADAVDSQLQKFDRWCADKEERICRAHAGVGDQLVVSLLSLEKDVRDAFSVTFDLLLAILRELVGYVVQSDNASDEEVWLLASLSSRVPPAAVTAHLLDACLRAAEEQSSLGDKITAEALTEVFVRSAQPVWAMVGCWAMDGMPVRDTWDSENHTLDEEFFVEDNELPLIDPDFWAEGYVLRTLSDFEAPRGGAQALSVPVFLERIADRILETGKAVGLLRILGIPLLDDPDGDPVDDQWPSLTMLIAQHKRVSLILVFDKIAPYYTSSGVQLTHTFISHFADVIFAKMDSQQHWQDFHFLNSAFRDVVDANNTTKCIETSLVRLSYRGSKTTAIAQTVKALDGLLVEYAVPFPLAYIFTPRVMSIYGSIFVFLLQIRRAKSVLERILVRGEIGSEQHMKHELKVFYAMRGKLSWFIKCVLYSQLATFHENFKGAKSLDEMIKIHNDHLDTIQCGCLLQPETSALHRAVLSALDMCLHFSNIFVSFSGDSTHDISRLSIIMKRHRSRRQRRLHRDVIGFSTPRIISNDESDDDDDDDEITGNAPEPSFSLAASVMSYEGDLPGHLDKLSSELDGVVRFVRRGSESSAPAFGVLAFALEDWDS